MNLDISTLLVSKRDGTTTLSDSSSNADTAWQQTVTIESINEEVVLAEATQSVNTRSIEVYTGSIAVSDVWWSLRGKVQLRFADSANENTPETKRDRAQPHPRSASAFP